MRNTSASELGWKFLIRSVETLVTDTEVLSADLSPPEAVTTISSSTLPGSFAATCAGAFWAYVALALAASTDEISIRRTR